MSIGTVASQTASDADHLRRAVAQLVNSAAAQIGQVMFIDNAPLRNSALISAPVACSVAVSLTGRNAGVGATAARASDLLGLIS